MNKANLAALVLLLGILDSSTASAGAWVQPEGKGFYKLGGRVVRANRFATVVVEADGVSTHTKSEPIPTLTDYTATFYGEYGLTEDLTLVVNFPFFRRITLNKQVFRDTGETVPGAEGFDSNGLSDLDVGIRYSVFRWGSTVLSAGLTLGIPTGTVQPPVSDPTSTEPDNGLYTSDGEFNVLATLNAGHSFSSLPIYLTGSVGFNYRTRGFSSEIRYSLEAGYTFLQDFILLVRATGVEPLRNGDSEVLGMTLGNDQRYLALAPELVYNISKVFGVSASFETALLLENTLSGPAVSAGFFAQF